MNLEIAVYLIVLILWLIAVAQGAISIVEGVRFHRYFRDAIDDARSLFDANGDFRYQPPATIIMPCKGVDEKLHHTVELLARQHYRDYELLFAFESESDPAYAAVKNWTANWDRPYKLIVAGLASRRSQKIHNLLAAMECVGAERDVIVFVDSDAEPDVDWLGFLVAPLQNDRVGAATGYRWYSAAGGMASGMRCLWNAATTVSLHDERRAFCWGGSTAIRRERFYSIGMPQYWDTALSDDLQMTRAIRAAGLLIHFVPQALVTSSDATTLGNFIAFARRQLIIVRVGTPHHWRWALSFVVIFVVGGAACLAVAIAAMAGWTSSTTIGWIAFAAAISLALLGVARAFMRQISMKLVLRERLTRADFWWDVLGTLTIAGSLHLQLLLMSAISRRFVWRNIEYEMMTPDDTRVVRRLV
ncbi:MAG: glycosyltransferase [Phycisphaerae bacterium]|nr:glycosyltransferase [Phycisphaerae bacterium]